MQNGKNMFIGLTQVFRVKFRYSENCKKASWPIFNSFLTVLSSVKS